MSFAALIRSMAEAGAPIEAIVLAVEAVEARSTFAKTQHVKEKGAERQARYRARLNGKSDAEQPSRNDGVTESDDVTPPPYDRSNPPGTSLRSERERAARAAAPEFRSAYPRRPGAKWQQATEKFIRLVRDGTDPALILDGTRRFAEFRAGEDPKYTPDPVVWLNNSRWLDDFERPVASRVAQPRDGPSDQPKHRNGIYAHLARRSAS